MNYNISYELEEDINSFIKEINEIPYGERPAKLRDLFIKHLQLEEEPKDLSLKDFEDIKSTATTLFSNSATHLNLEGVPLDLEQRRLFCMVEATISCLRKTGALRKIVRMLVKRY